MFTSGFGAKWEGFCDWLFSEGDDVFRKGVWVWSMLAALSFFIGMYYLGKDFGFFRWSVYVFVLVTLLPLLASRLLIKAFKEPLLWTIVVFGSYMAVTALWQTDDFYIFKKELRHLLLLMFFILGLALLQYQVNVARVVQTVLFSVCALLAIISLIYFYSLHPFSTRLRSYGILGNSAQLIYGLGLGFVCGASLLFSMEKSKYSVGVWVGLVVILLAAILTYSRGGILAIASVAIGFSVLIYGKRFGVVLVVFAFGLGAGALVFLEIENLRITSILARYEIWERLLDDMGSRWLLGVGVDGRDLWGLLAPLGSHAHSVFLSTYYRGGAIGLAMLFVLLFVIAKRLVGLERSSARIFLCAALGFAFVISITDLGDLFWRPSYLWMYFWLPVGLLLGESIRCAERKNNMVDVL